MQTPLRYVSVHYCPLAAVTTVCPNVVFGPLASAYAVLVTVLALAIVVVLGGRTLGNAEWAVLHVFTFVAMVSVWPRASAVAFLVAGLAHFLVSLINPADDSDTD